MKLSTVAQRTGLSQRYWQQRAASGKIPNTSRIVLGKRKIYLVQIEGFDDWWRKQLKPVQSHETWARSINSKLARLQGLKDVESNRGNGTTTRTDYRGKRTRNWGLPKSR